MGLILVILLFVIDLDESKLIKLIVGSGNEIQKQHEEVEDEEQQNEEEEKEEEEQLKIKYDKRLYISKFAFQNTTMIEHLNCPICDKDCCIRLFKSSDIQINNKDIYISFNIMTQKIIEYDDYYYEKLKEDNPEKLQEYRRKAYLNRKEKLKNLEKEKVENI